MELNQKIFLPPEWFPQSGVMLTWPHEKTDWIDLIDEVETCFSLIANEILKVEKLLIIASNPARVIAKIESSLHENLILVQHKSNDTWARDHGAISVFIDNLPHLIDFQFNGWGLKFPANHDNQLTSKLFRQSVFQKEVSYLNRLNFVLEGGSFEVDGKGTLLTTADCLLSVNRNQNRSKEEIEEFLINNLGVHRILWLSAGFLEGDDTDGHVDTLARFCNENTIAYVKCTDPSDIHYQQLSIMERELKSFQTSDGTPYHLIELPMAEFVEDQDRKRLPATYANFLIINKKVLVPCYSTPSDRIALEQLAIAFPDREIVGIECSVLIKQHGSLHCVTMQFPLGVL